MIDIVYVTATVSGQLENHLGDGPMAMPVRDYLIRLIHEDPSLLWAGPFPGRNPGFPKWRGLIRQSRSLCFASRLRM